MKLLLTISILCGIAIHSRAQKEISFETKREISWAAVDRAGDLFLVCKDGLVMKHTKELKQIGAHNFSTQPTLLDPLDGVQAFYFDEATSVYGNLSSDLSSVTKNIIDPAFAVRPWLVCPSLHELWILDSADFSIKKTKMKSAAISLESVLIHLPSKKVEDYFYMREYQNYLFLLDKKAGIHVYNGLGRYVKTIGESGITYFSFFGEEVYYQKNQQLFLTDLYTNEKRTVELPKPARFALLCDDYIYLVNDHSVTVVAFKQ